MILTHGISVTILILTTLLVGYLHRTPLVHGQEISSTVTILQETLIKLVVSPSVKYFGTNYATSRTNLTAKAEILSPPWISLGFDQINNVTYKWSTKDGPIEQSMGSQIVIAFPHQDDGQFLQVDVYQDQGQNVSTLLGSNRLNLVIQDPVIVSDPIGKLFLEHGELLNVRLIFNGTKPFSYCYKFCRDTDILPCDFCFGREETNNETISISQYLHHVGNYTLMFDIQNLVSHETKHYRIKINETTRQQTIPYAPIVCSCLAVLILLSGVALHLHHRKSNYLAETANFDFIRHNQGDDEDWDEELSFIQRVRYLFCHGSEDDDEFTFQTNGYHQSRNNGERKQLISKPETMVLSYT